MPMNIKGGRLCSFSPCVEQVQRTCEVLRARGFVDVVTLECLERPYEVKQVVMADIRDTCRAPSGGQALKKEEHATAEVLQTTEGDAMTGVEEPSESPDAPEAGAEGEAKATGETRRGKKRRGHPEDPATAAQGFSFQAAIPSLQIPGHTGYLTFATLLAS